MSSTPVSAADIRENVKESLKQLILLQEQGRVVMTQDSYNTEFRNSTSALDEAIRALDRALDAMTWMETLPHPNGGYPPITES